VDQAECLVLGELGVEWEITLPDAKEADVSPVRVPNVWRNRLPVSLVPLLAAFALMPAGEAAAQLDRDDLLDYEDIGFFSSGSKQVDVYLYEYKQVSAVGFQFLNDATGSIDLGFKMYEPDKIKRGRGDKGKSTISQNAQVGVRVKFGGGGTPPWMKVDGCRGKVIIKGPDEAKYSFKCKETWLEVLETLGLDAGQINRTLSALGTRPNKKAGLKGQGTD
jgi:hypothetical protein